MTTFKKLSNGKLADEIGDLTSQIKVLDMALSDAKKEFKTRGKSVATGNQYEVKLVDANGSALDRQAVIDKLGADWVKTNTKSIPYQQVRVTVLASALLAA